MSLFDDAMLTEPDVSLYFERADHLAKRAEAAFRDLGLPVKVKADDLGIKITVTAWLDAGEVRADRFVCLLEDLARERTG
jgi:hypothetical protein